LHTFRALHSSRREHKIGGGRHTENRSHPAGGFEPKGFDRVLSRFPWSSTQVSERLVCDAGIEQRRCLPPEQSMAWEKPRRSGEQLGLGMYPHFEVSDAAATVEKARQAGYRIVQEPKKYDFGTEAFIADPDGYTWAFVSPPKVASDH
jgi:catechol 2,3-dioxygenase-like lactoylglutathione lyase family enzyme